MLGSHDLLVLFTGTMCHKMARAALNETKRLDTVVARSYSGSLTALKNILDEYVA